MIDTNLSRKPSWTTRVPQVLPCPPRGWSGARVGVGMLRGAGDSLLEKSIGFKVQSFKISKVSKISKIQNVKVSKLQSFRTSKIQSSEVSFFKLSML